MLTWRPLIGLRISLGFPTMVLPMPHGAKVRQRRLSLGVKAWVSKPHHFHPIYFFKSILPYIHWSPVTLKELKPVGSDLQARSLAWNHYQK